MTANSIISLFAADSRINIEIKEYYELNPVNKFSKKLYRKNIWEVYNQLQRKGKSNITYILLSVFLKIAISITKRKAARALKSFLAEKKPELVISVIPLVNHIIYNATNELKITFLTLMIDFSEPAKNVWFQHKKQKMIVCTEKALKQAEKFGIRKEDIYFINGALIDPKYYRIKEKSENDELNNHILLIWGGEGCNRMLKYIKRLEESDIEQVFIYCIGSNPGAEHEVKKLIKRCDSLVVNYTNEIENYYIKSKLIVGKPGPGVISEALFLNKYLLMELNSKTLLQERFNARWVADQGCGRLFKNEEELVSNIKLFLQSEIRMQAVINNSNEKITQLIYEALQITSVG